ncbi:hypothetical protein DL98DRAFT_570090 [Cadophora sp. DSE1049]|nr:hypothetical protein DL98DRAFT_570090 [Cadophora sp. DSE1049]
MNKDEQVVEKSQTKQALDGFYDDLETNVAAPEGKSRLRLPTSTCINLSFRFICCLLLAAASHQQVSLPGVGIDDPNQPPALQDGVDSTTSQQALSSTLVKSSTSTISTIPSATQTISTPEGSGLATGAKAGIGVGAALGIILLIGIAVFTVRRQRRSRVVKSGAAEERFEKAELGTHPKSSVTKSSPVEIDGAAERPVEVGKGKGMRVELEGRMQLSELA